MKEETCPYNDPTKHGHTPLPHLSQTAVLEKASKIHEARALPPLQLPNWRKMNCGFGWLAQVLEKYASYLESTTVRMNQAHAMMDAGRNLESGSSASVVRKEATVRTAKKAERYKSIEEALVNSRPYAAVVFLNDNMPTDRRRKYNSVHEIELPFPFEVYSCHQGGSLGTLWWVWRAPMDPLETDMNVSHHLMRELSKEIKDFKTRAMRREFVSRFQLVAKTSRTVLNEMFRLLTGHATACTDSISKTVRERLFLCLDGQDPDLIFDLRHLNEHACYDRFWAECQSLIQEQALEAVDSCRHGNVTHMAIAYSARDLLTKVVARLPAEERADVPSESWF